MFIAKISKEKDKFNLVVFDDPVSSYDENRRLSILNLIVDKFYDDKYTGQTILVLSHDQSFVQYLSLQKIKGNYISEKRSNIKGKISYFDISLEGNAVIKDVEDEDVGNLEFFIKENIKQINDNLDKKKYYPNFIVNFRLYFDLQKQKYKKDCPDELKNYYDYFTNILYYCKAKK